MNDTATSTKAHRTRNAILCMLSGFILLFIVALLQMIIHFVLPQSTTDTATLTTLITQIINIISALAGLLGIFLIPIGLIVGIVRLSRS